MNSYLRKLFLRPSFAFLMFALLLGARDVGAEVIFNKSRAEASLCFAFLVCATITVISLLLVIQGHGLQELLKKIFERHVLPRVIVVGGSAAIVYLVTFYMIHEVGAGYFDLFDYGLAPILTAALGIVFFSNLFTRRLAIAVLAYCVGIFLLLWKGTNGWAWVSVALLSPVGTAVSDAMTKWLLSPEHGKLSRSDLLLVRFLPATILIGIVILLRTGEIHLHNPVQSIPLAIVGGFLPLWFLCTGLGRASLTQYAVWEFLIPAIAFFGTLPIRPGNLTVNSTIGAIIVLLAVVIHEVNLPASFKRVAFLKARSSAATTPTVG